ncbi:MAG TPA: phosphonoacetaldehyde hydrolase [Anaerolineae bacterium]|nr:phosphonoacetaldehyde hydrolase [Anaerolineae bacterium]
MMQFFFKRLYRGPLQTIILDWSGTTIDYGSLAPAQVFLDLFAQFGVPITVGEARDGMGLHKKEHIRRLTQTVHIHQKWQEVHGRPPSELDVNEMYDQFASRQFDVLANYTDLIPGTLDAVKYFRQRKLKIGSSTGYSRTMLDIILPAAKQQGYEPDAVACASDVTAGRPAPWLFWHNLMQLNVYPAETAVAVGDTSRDIAAGLNAGIWTVGVALTGNALGLSEAELAQVRALDPITFNAQKERAYQKLYQAGAHYVVDTIADVPRILDDIQDHLNRGERP